MFKKYSKIAKLYKMKKRLIERREELIKLEETVQYLISVSRTEGAKQSLKDQLLSLEDEMYLYTEAIVDTQINIENIRAS